MASLSFYGGVGEIHQVHASGHCSRGEIEAISREVGPGALFPVYGEHPELLRGLAKKVWELIEMEETHKLI